MEQNLEYKAATPTFSNILENWDAGNFQDFHFPWDECRGVNDAPALNVDLDDLIDLDLFDDNPKPQSNPKEETPGNSDIVAAALSLSNGLKCDICTYSFTEANEPETFKDCGHMVCKSCFMWHNDFSRGKCPCCHKGPSEPVKNEVMLAESRPSITNAGGEEDYLDLLNSVDGPKKPSQNAIINDFQKFLAEKRSMGMGTSKQRISGTGTGVKRGQGQTSSSSSSRKPGGGISKPVAKSRPQNSQIKHLKARVSPTVEGEGADPKLDASKQEKNPGQNICIRPIGQSQKPVAAAAAVKRPSSALSSSSSDSKTVKKGISPVLTIFIGTHDQLQRANGPKQPKILRKAVPSSSNRHLQTIKYLALPQPKIVHRPNPQPNSSASSQCQTGQVIRLPNILLPKYKFANANVNANVDMQLQ